MSTCDPNTNLTGCEPPFPPQPTPSPTPADLSLCICDVGSGLTGVAGTLDNIAPDSQTTGTSSEGYVVDVFVRKDVASSGTQLEDAFYLRWAAPLAGENFYDPANYSNNCGFAPTLYAFRGQWIVFRQQDSSNVDHPICITTSATGDVDSVLYTITGTAETNGNIIYRNGSVELDSPAENNSYDHYLDLVGTCLSSTCDAEWDCNGEPRPCPNLAFRIPACAPDVLYYRHYTEGGNEIRGGKIVILGALPGFECTTDEECVPHERPWEIPLAPLSLGDTFYEWYNTTNNIIAALDPLRIYDVKALGGLKELIPATNGILYLEADVGPGLRIYPPTSPLNGLPQDCASGKIVLDIFGLPEVEVTGAFDPFEDRKSRNQVKETDLFVFERFVDDDGFGSRRGIDPHNTPANIFKVKAENLLPYTIAGDHRFTGKIAFESPAMEINATKLTIDDKAIELGASPFIEFSVVLVSGTAAQLIAGMSHDPDGDSYYYEGDSETDGTTPGNTYTGLTGELVVQEHIVYSTYARTEPKPDTVGEYTDDPYDLVTGDYLNRGPGYNPTDTDGGGNLIHSDDAGTEQVPELIGTEYSRATILSISNITDGTATVKVRVYNDVPFVTGKVAYTTRSGVRFTISSIAGQSGTDTDINGGGVILNSTDGNKSILWANSNDAWTLNQNLAVDTRFHVLTPFNIANGTTNYADNSSGAHDYWNVHQYMDVTTLTGNHCLGSSDDGLLHFAYVPVGVIGTNGHLPALSILPCGGIYIHNLTCSPQFKVEGGLTPNSIVVSNEFGVLHHTQQDRIFVPVTGAVNYTDFEVGDVVGIAANGALFLAQADNRDDAEVLGIVVQQITGGGDDCDIGGGAAASEGWLIAVGNLIDWTAGMCGLADITPGSVYFLNPITGGTLVDCEPLELGHIRKPVALAVNDSQLLVTNYEGVVNGDYFQENPVLRLDDLRDVDAPTTGADAVTGGQILVWNGTTSMWENTSSRLPNTPPPATSDGSGIAGEVRFDSSHLYVCIATDTWRRVALSNWS